MSNTILYESYIDKILDFWFETKLDYNKWFHSQGKYDTYIKKNFSKILSLAEKGYLLDWLNSFKSYLAMIILMDQFSRHIYKGTPKAYKNDKKILLFTEMGLDIYLEKATAEQQMFILLPYQHSEDIDSQNFGLAVLENIIKKTNVPKDKEILRQLLYHQQKHRNVIKEFGRFPKRNIILGRQSSEEEIDYIDENTKFDY